VTFEQALDQLATGGRLVCVGLSDQEPSIGSTTTVGLTQRQVLGHLGYENADIGTLAMLVSRGRLDLSRSISAVIGLEDIERGIEMLEKQEGNPIRILVQP
jgi:threonine dehydrogenase-like Zn-dependent dehydrogenase